MADSNLQRSVTTTTARRLATTTKTAPQMGRITGHMLAAIISRNVDDVKLRPIEVWGRWLDN